MRGKREEERRKKEASKIDARDRGREKIRSLKHPLGLRSRIKSSLDVNVCGAGRLGAFVEVIFCQKVDKLQKLSRKIPISPGNSDVFQTRFFYRSSIERFLTAAIKSDQVGTRIEENIDETKTRAEEITSTGSRGRFAGV